MEKEYIIVVHDPVDLPTLEEELQASYGNQFVVDRSANCSNSRPGSKYQSNWMLTDEEAATLLKDPRINIVEEKQEYDLELDVIQEGTFTRGWYADGRPDFVNYGLQRVNAATNEYRESRNLPVSANDGNPTTLFVGLDGTGVDIVITDTGIDHHHPDLFDAAGNSRVKQIDWYEVTGMPGSLGSSFYEDSNGHGTSAASVSAGLVHGFAKNADIYSIAMLRQYNPSAVSTATMYDFIRIWHQNKNDPNHATYTGRPTIVNMSWGLGTYNITYADITGGTFRGQEWTRGNLTDEEMARRYGMPITGGDTFPVYGQQGASTEADIKELCDMPGIHVFKSSGNYMLRGVDIGSDDYNNSFNRDGTTDIFYNRPSSPYDPQQYRIGNIEHMGWYGPNGDQDSCSRCATGPATHWYCPGNGTMSASSSQRTASVADVRYGPNQQFAQRHFSGTSASSPISAGVAALHLQADPSLSAADLRQRMIDDCKVGVLYDASYDPEIPEEESFGVVRNGLSKGENRILFNRFNKPSLKVSGDFTGKLKGLSIE